jgi:hypothetical protein
MLLSGNKTGVESAAPWHDESEAETGIAMPWLAADPVIICLRTVKRARFCRPITALARTMPIVRRSRN